jgi:pyridoxal 5'-phosphate synthase pdxT subunit
MTQPKLKIGVLALQGAFREHKQTLERLDTQVAEVRLPRDLAGLSGLIIPGGESTTMGKLMVDYDLLEPIREFCSSGGAIWGTCAGAILLAKHIEGVPPQFGTQPSLELMDIRVRRNAFGRQVDSFEAPLVVEGLETAFNAVFIRAPIIEWVGEGVEVLSRADGEIVLVRAGKLLASSFHPELTGDSRLHELFLGMVEDSK